MRVNPPAAGIRDLAARIVATGLHDHRELEMPQRLGKFFSRLRDIWTPMVGELGFAAVLKRAVWLAARSAEAQGFPADAALTEADFRALVEKAGADRTVRWAEEIVQQALSLLMSFLGERLTLRILERTYPGSAKTVKEVQE
jgi:hypothetical protein